MRGLARRILGLLHSYQDELSSYLDQESSVGCSHLTRYRCFCQVLPFLLTNILFLANISQTWRQQRRFAMLSRFTLLVFLVLSALSTACNPARYAGATDHMAAASAVNIQKPGYTTDRSHYVVCQRIDNPSASVYQQSIVQQLKKELSDIACYTAQRRSRARNPAEGNRHQFHNFAPQFEERGNVACGYVKMSETVIECIK